MAYTKQTWTDRQGTKLNKFTKANETLTTVELTNAPESITQAGTPFSKTRMDYMEEGIRTGHVIGTPLSDLNRVFHLTGNGIPTFPDNVAGAGYFNNIFANTDSWASTNGTVSASNGILSSSYTSGSVFNLNRNIATTSGKEVILLISKTGAIDSVDFEYKISGTYYTIAGIPVTKQFTMVPLLIPTAGDVDYIAIRGNGPSAGAKLNIKGIYIGSGLFDTPVYGADGKSVGINTGGLPVNGKRGNGIKFLWSNSFGIVFDSPIIGTTGKVKISFKRDAIGEDHVFLSNAISASAFYGWTIIVKNTNVLTLWNGGTGAYQEVPIVSVADTNDHTFCFDCNGTNIHYAFDGGALQTVALTVTPAQSTLPLTIGRNVTPSGFVRGVVYDVRYDTGTLSQDEVLRYHNGDDAVDSQQKAVTAVPHSIVTRDANGGINASNMFAYDLVIDSDAKLASWAASGTWEKVLIKKGTWTLASGGVDLTARGTKVVIGEPGSKLVFSASANGLYYSTRPTTNNYKMDGVNVECSNTSGSVLAIRDCINLKECTAIATSYGAASTAGFAYCYNMINCIGTGSGSTVGSGFSDCLYCVNCKGFGSGSNEGIGFGSCRYLSGCYASGTGIGTGIGDGLKLCLRVTICESYGYTGTGSSYGMAGCKSCTNNKAFAGTANYSNSYADSGTSYACADTPNGGFNS